MENAEDEDDLKLVKASAGLLSDLESALPKLLWRPSSSATSHGPVHTQVRKRDLDYVIKLVRQITIHTCTNMLIARNR